MTISQNTVEYAVQTMMKKKASVKTAAKDAVAKFHGTENWALGSGVLHLDQNEMEDAIWARIIENVLKSMKSLKEGKEHYALDFASDLFGQSKSKTFRSDLKKRVVFVLQSNPFVQDDRA